MIMQHVSAAMPGMLDCKSMRCGVDNAATKRASGVLTSARNTSSAIHPGILNLDVYSAPAFCTLRKDIVVTPNRVIISCGVSGRKQIGCEHFHHTVSSEIQRSGKIWKAIPDDFSQVHHAE